MPSVAQLPVAALIALIRPEHVWWSVNQNQRLSSTG